MASPIRRAVILPNMQKDADLSLSLQTAKALSAFCTDLYAPAENELLMKTGVKGYTAEAFPEDVQLIVVIGGDGSILHAAHLAVKADVP
ncbi:MAG: NAD(+)/NADH kinase, partial [Clostridia bacterium]|nr:NAD(+)/NADH kinase [Clostridia bacterium]